VCPRRAEESFFGSVRGGNFGSDLRLVKQLQKSNSEEDIWWNGLIADSVLRNNVVVLETNVELLSDRNSYKVVETFDCLIAELAQNGREEAVVTVVETMRKKGIGPSQFTNQCIALLKTKEK